MFLVFTRLLLDNTVLYFQSTVECTLIVLFFLFFDKYIYKFNYRKDGHL